MKLVGKLELESIYLVEDGDDYWIAMLRRNKAKKVVSRASAIAHGDWVEVSDEEEQFALTESRRLIEEAKKAV